MLDLTAKISSANTASLSLFQSLGFEKIRSNPDADENEGEEPRPNYFGEWEVRLPRAMALKIRDGFVGEGYREVRFEGTVMG